MRAGVAVGERGGGARARLLKEVGRVVGGVKRARRERRRRAAKEPRPLGVELRAHGPDCERREGAGVRLERRELRPQPILHRRRRARAVVDRGKLAVGVKVGGDERKFAHHRERPPAGVDEKGRVVAVDGERRHAEQVGAERLEHRQVALPDRRVAVGEVVGAVGARGSGVVRDAARDERRAVEQQVGARGDEAAARRLARRAAEDGRPRRPRRRRGRRRRGWRVFAGAEVAGCFFKLRGNERREGYEEDKAEARTHHRPKVVLAVDASICAV